MKYNGLQLNIEEWEDLEGEYNNCYTYAINQPFNPYTGFPYETYKQCQPSNLGKNPNSYKYTSDKNFYKNLIKNATKDLNEIGYELRKSSFEEYIENEKAWKIALVISKQGKNYRDYHWYRQNADGTWSHKKGMNHVRTTDDSGDIITNPTKCNRGMYNIFCGFYIISPKSLDKIKLN